MKTENYNKSISRFKKIEFILYLVIWGAVFSVPFFRFRSSNTVIWEKVYLEWVMMLALLVIFTLNVYVFVPKLLFVKKYSKYIISILAFVLVMVSVTIWTQKQIEVHTISTMPPMNLGPGMPPMELGSSMPAPMGYRETVVSQQKSLYMTIADYLIISFLLVGASTTLKIMSRWLNEENRRKDLEKEQLRTELALLRHQVNPHFLMNTLNNIHALIDLNVDLAKDAVIKLSVLMRYLLYDSAQGKTTLEKEIEFMGSYIELMKLRYSKKISIEFSVPDKIPDVKIPPMLFISYLENAFKHGVSYQSKSFVSFKLDIQDNKLICNVKNSKHNGLNLTEKKYSGIGMSNIRKNLELLYPGSHQLDVIDGKNVYEIKLTLPL